MEIQKAFENNGGVTGHEKSEKNKIINDFK